MSAWERGQWRPTLTDPREIAERGVELLGPDLVALLVAPPLEPERPRRIPVTEAEWADALRSRAPEWATALAGRMERIERRIETLVVTVTGLSVAPAPVPESPFLTIGDAAAIFHVSKATIVRWQKLGRLPVVRLGRRRLTTKVGIAKLVTRVEHGAEP